MTGAQPTSTSSTILVVDEEVLIRFAIADYLRDCGYRVIEAASGKEAMLVIEKSDLKIDIVLCDAALKGKVNELDLSNELERTKQASRHYCRHAGESGGCSGRALRRRPQPRPACGGEQARASAHHNELATHFADGEALSCGKRR